MNHCNQLGQWQPLGQITEKKPSTIWSLIKLGALLGVGYFAISKAGEMVGKGAKRSFAKGAKAGEKKHRRRRH